MELYYIYYLPNEPKVGMTSRTGSDRNQRIQEQSWSPVNKNIDGVVWIAAATSYKEAKQIERQYQIIYDCLDGMNNPNVIQKIAEKNTGRKNTPQAIDNMIQASVGKNKGYTPWNKNIKMTEEQTKNMKGHVPWNKGMRGTDNHQYGIKKELIQCPHCNKVGGSGAMQRWHFDNCKQRP